MMLSTSIAWNDAKQDSEWCQSQPYWGLYWVAEGCNPNPKSGTYLTLLRGVACQQFKISYNTMSAVNSARVAGTALL